MKELKFILKNLGIMGVVVGSIVFFMFYIYFPFKTNHGDTITVPNLVGMSLEEIILFQNHQGHLQMQMMI